MAGAVIGWIAVGGLALASVAAGYWAMRRQTSPVCRVVGMPDSPPDSVFLGGALTPTVSAGRPMAPVPPLSVPTWEARYEQLAVVRSVTGVGTTGLRLAVADSTDAVVFWTSQWPQILDRLEAAGASVDRSPVRLKHAGGVYRTWPGSTS